MKNTLLTLTFFAFIFSCADAQNKIDVTTGIKKVTVFLSGAEITSEESVSLKKGTTVIRFNGLAPDVSQNGIQLTAPEGVELVAISTLQQHLDPSKINPTVKVLSDSIQLLEDEITSLKNQQDAYAVEKKTLEQNQHLATATGGITLVDLAKAADFFRDRTLKINTATTLIDKKKAAIEKLLLIKQTELHAELANTALARTSVTVTVNANVGLQAQFTLRYFVTTASWDASYDIASADISSPVVLKYKAVVYNETSLDWKNVKLTLSTGDVSKSATRPFLTTWILNYAAVANEGVLNNLYQNFARAVDTTNLFEAKSVPEANTDFEIDQSHTIPSSDEPYRIELKSETLQATYEYLAVPKLEPAAFLVAKITGWQKLNLIDGTANIYYGNTFVGESAINTRIIGDTLELSLGRDNQIIVSRSKIEDKSSVVSIGGKKTESFLYEIQLRNNHKTPVLIKIQDQIPVSQEKDILVEASELSKAVLDVPSGRIQWIKTLGAGEKINYRIAFSVKYPKKPNGKYSPKPNGQNTAL